MSQDKEIKDCPCCGNSWGPPQTEQEDATSDGRWHVFCTNAHCGTSSGWADTEEEAIDLWNKRPTPPKTSMTLNAHMLREALEFANPDGDGDPDQMNTELTFRDLSKEEAAKMATENDEGYPYPAGIYCWPTEYPEEGCLGPLGMCFFNNEWIKVET